MTPATAPARRHPRAPLVVPLLLVALLALAGCGGGEEEGGADGAGAGSTTSSLVLEPVEPGEGPEPPTAAELVELRAELAGVEGYCEVLDVVGEAATRMAMAAPEPAEVEAFLLLGMAALERQAQLAPEELSGDYEVLLGAYPAVVAEAEAAGWDPEVVLASDFGSSAITPEVEAAEQRIAEDQLARCAPEAPDGGGGDGGGEP